MHYKITLQSILDPFSKLLSFTILNCSFKLQQVLDICSLCNRVFAKVGTTFLVFLTNSSVRYIHV